MAKVLATGMSGTGKSTTLRVLAARGHRTVDTDTDEWSHWVTAPDGSPDWVWREDAMTALLDGHREAVLRDLALVEPLLRATATYEIDASAPLDSVVRQLEALGQRDAPVPPGRDRGIATLAS
ncbi:hypothetical protein [Nonomuraea sp. NPDC050786]|uniref:hypothetical protein n=1 Tax=Nonomuraea sp. NPDC050786 TaxID=3154840 RepID=UPI0033EF7529